MSWLMSWLPVSKKGGAIKFIRWMECSYPVFSRQFLKDYHCLFSPSLLLFIVSSSKSLIFRQTWHPGCHHWNLCRGERGEPALQSYPLTSINMQCNMTHAYPPTHYMHIIWRFMIVMMMTPRLSGLPDRCSPQWAISSNVSISNYLEERGWVTEQVTTKTRLRGQTSESFWCGRHGGFSMRTEE